MRVVTQNYRQLPDGSLQEVRLEATGGVKAQHLPAAAAAGGKAATLPIAGACRLAMANCSCVNSAVGELL